MTSHRREGRHWLSRRGPILPAPPPSVELVDGGTKVMHRVTTDELMAASKVGWCRALCGMRIVAASLTDPGRRRCRVCAS